MADKTAGKQRGRPFLRGESGNPAGRPMGARHKATVAAEALLDGEAEALTPQGSRDGARRRRHGPALMSRPDPLDRIVDDLVLLGFAQLFEEFVTEDAEPAMGVRDERETEMAAVFPANKDTPIRSPLAGVRGAFWLKAGRCGRIGSGEDAPTPRIGNRQTGRPTS